MSCWPSIFAGAVRRVPGADASSSSATRPSWRNGSATPDGFWEFVFGYPWPIGWAYWIAGAGGRGGADRRPLETRRPGWLIALPLAWLVWECIAGTHSVDPALTSATLKHFAACVLCFYLGCFSLSRVQEPLAVLAGLAGRLAAGPGSRLGAALRRPGGDAPLLLPVCLSPDEGSPAGVSEEDLQQPHLLDALLPQRPGRGCCSCCCRSRWRRSGNCAGCLTAAARGFLIAVLVERRGWPACTGPGPKAGGC